MAELRAAAVEASDAGDDRSALELSRQAADLLATVESSATGAAPNRLQLVLEPEDDDIGTSVDQGKPAPGRAARSEREQPERRTLVDFEEASQAPPVALSARVAPHGLTAVHVAVLPPSSSGAMSVLPLTDGTISPRGALVAVLVTGDPRLLHWLQTVEPVGGVDAEVSAESARPAQKRRRT